MDTVSGSHESVVSSASYIASLTLLAFLLAEATAKAKELRWVYAGLVYLTTILWYSIDPWYTPTDYTRFTSSEVSLAYSQVVWFLLAFRIAVSGMITNTPTSLLRSFDIRSFDRRHVVRAAVLLWLALWMVGVALGDYRITELMFPLQGRFTGVAMFGRGRIAGEYGFLLSTASYVYLLLCSLFGVLGVVTSRQSTRVLMTALCAWTWPMFFLGGTRHLAVAVALPSIFAVLLVKRWSRMKQIMFVALCAVILNTLMLGAIHFRTVGLGRAIERGAVVDEFQRARHQGLNMILELLFINRYQKQGLLPVEYGQNYAAHLLNFIPRAVWPDKPLVGYRFAELRVGKRRGEVAATIAFGFIGQGVANFGSVLGAVFPALLLGLLGRWLVALPRRGLRPLRVLLVLFAFGSIPNLGRDITLFVLWPVVFAYLLLLIYEHNAKGIVART